MKETHFKANLGEFNRHEAELNVRASSFTNKNIQGWRTRSKIIFLNIFLLISEKKGEGERDKKIRNINDERQSLIFCLLHAPTGAGAHNLVMCP